MAAKKAAHDVCTARFEAFGCGAQADRIRPIALDTMIKRYE
jgi:fructose-bisphosphate aldolase class II